MINLVNVVPELAVNGQVVKIGSSMKLGEELPFITALSFAGSVSPAQQQAVKTQLKNQRGQTRLILN